MNFRIAMLALALVTWTSAASAGTVTLRDGSSLLTSSDVAVLSSSAKDWPFDLHIIVANVPNRSDFLTEAVTISVSRCGKRSA